MFEIHRGDIQHKILSVVEWPFFFNRLIVYSCLLTKGVQLCIDCSGILANTRLVLCFS